MKNHTKKILSVFAAATMLASSIALAGCSTTTYKGDTMDGYQSAAEVSSQGGFVVEKGDFVYFINGIEEYTADNTYGNVVKGALMRISKADLAEKNYANVKMVVPSLLVEQNYSSGIYIYGDYVYYASPVTDKDKTGTVLNSMLDFKRAKIDGTAAPEEKHLVRTTSNNVKYRFVEENNKVYCLYEESDDAGVKYLKSYDVDAKSTTVLVKSAKSEFFFDSSDLTNGNVYYTMAVVNNIDTDYQSTASYDQLFCVNAATKMELNASKAEYKAVLNGTTVKTYDFNENYFKSKNQEAKNNKEKEPYNLSDITTYPYVNLGQLVLDGAGKNAKSEAMYNEDNVADAVAIDGYTYTLSSYQNGGVYFTRTDVNSTSSVAENENLYYLSDDDGLSASWNTISGQIDSLTTVAINTTKASANAIFTYDETTDTHQYFYLNNDVLYKAGQPVNGVAEETAMAQLSGATLFKIEGDYLYYYMSATNGYNIARIKHNGTGYDYNVLMNKKEYQPVIVTYVDWAKNWYLPEFVTVKKGGEEVELFLYANAQKIIGTTYNYIYATELGTNAELEQNSKDYAAVEEYIDEKTNSGDDIRDAMEYYFHTGKTEAFEAVRSLYTDYADQAKVFDDFVKEFTNNNLKKESEFIGMIGGSKAFKAGDEDQINAAWADSLKSEKEEENKEEGLPTWAIVLIVVGSVLVVAGVTVVLVIVSKKKKEQKAQEDATVNAYKRKIDTTDDKTIDVYADAEKEEKAEEPAAEVAEEATEEVSKEVVEETAAEEPVEEVAEESVETAPVEETAEQPAEEKAEE